MVQYAFVISLIFTLALAFAGPRPLSAEQSETDKSMSDKQWAWSVPPSDS